MLNVNICQDQRYALINFKPLTGNDDQSSMSVILIENGRITAVGQSELLAADVPQIDL